MLSTHPMNALSQLDIQSPDHVTVITRDGKVTVSVIKDGTSVTLGFPIATTFTPKEIPTQQQRLALVQTKMSSVVPRNKPTGTTHLRYVGPTPKLTEQQVREIKMMVSDPEIISKFPSMTEAHKEIGRAYNVTGCAIGNIARGISWKHIKV
jgi:hypothetical protein